MIYQEIIFTKNECELIINSHESFKKKWKDFDRNYNASIIEYKDSTKWIFDKYKTFFEKNTNHKILNLKKYIHFHEYNENDWFGKHNDARKNRCFAIGTLLNDDFSDGDFIFYDKKTTILNKEIGNTYIFDVNLFHEIKPILNGKRYSMLWFLEEENIELKRNKLL